MNPISAARQACWLALALALAVPAAAQPVPTAVPPLERAANDRSQLRRLVLPNGMKVLLLSDPKLNNASASLAVAVGSFANPTERPGLAHFLEHMLFLGTEKYPDATDFSAYLGRNGGMHNAYTASDRTNYHFEIRHEAFEGALDRFAQFFVAPLFDPRFTEREINAVNSEHQKNLESDFWREAQLGSRVYRADHPAAKFGTGSRQTLAGTTREELLAFYRQHYSADRMALTLLGRASLDQLEQWARKMFAAVPTRPTVEPRVEPDYLPRKAALRLLRMEPIKDLRHLHLEFPLPSVHALWPGKPHELLGYILGSEGPGSLLAQLKAEGLATGLSAGVQPPAKEFASLDMQINLTPEGQQKLPRVLGLVFATVRLLREQGLPPHLFQERQALARLDERYRDPGEGAMRAATLANLVLDYPFEVAERVPYLWLQEDRAGFQALVAQLTPDNMLATLVAKGVPTDRTEPIYGTRYSYSEDSGAAYTALLNPPPVATIQLPRPNPFVPARTALLPLQPVRLLDEPTLSLYYAQDTEFQRPMAAHVLRFRLPRSLAGLRSAVLLRFYEACVREALNETTYQAAEAGLHFGFAASFDGVSLQAEGYDEAAARLLDAVAGGIVDCPLNAERFADLKEKLVRELAAFSQSDAYQAVGEARRSVVREFHYRPDEQLPLAREVTLPQVREFARTLFTRGKLEALSLGNLGATEAVAAVRRLAARLHTQPVPDAELLRRRVLVMTPGESLRTSERLQVNNSAFQREVLLGGDNAETRAATLLFSAFIGDPFFSELRTRQQLGYIVSADAAEDARSLFAYFLIQSGEYPADVLEARADAFIQDLPRQLAALPEEGWQALVGGARSKLEEQDKTIAERARRLALLAYDRDADWGRRAATLQALDQMTQTRAVELLRGALDPATRRMRTFLGFAREHQPQSPPQVSFQNREAWKKTRRYQ